MEAATITQQARATAEMAVVTQVGWMAAETVVVQEAETEEAVVADTADNPQAASEQP